VFPVRSPVRAQARQPSHPPTRGPGHPTTRWLTRPALSRRLLGPIHAGVGPSLRAVFVGGAFTDPATLQFFRDLGFPVANGYGLTEACTVLTLNDVSSPRTDTVGKPLPGVDIRILEPDRDGIGQVAVRGQTVMLGYLDDPAMTAETIAVVKWCPGLPALRAYRGPVGQRKQLPGMRV